MQIRCVACNPSPCKSVLSIKDSVPMGAVPGTGRWQGVGRMDPWIRRLLSLGSVVFDLSSPPLSLFSSRLFFNYFLIYLASSGLSCSPWDLHCLTWILPYGTWTLIETCGFSCPDAWKILVPRPEIEPMSLTLPDEFFFYYFFINMFVLGCGVLVVVHGLSLVGRWCAGFSLQWLLLLWSVGCRCVGAKHMGFSIAVCGLRSCHLCGCSSFGTLALLPQGMWDLPGPGIEPMSPALQDRFLTTGPPGKSHPSLGI